MRFGPAATVPACTSALHKDVGTGTGLLAGDAGWIWDARGGGRRGNGSGCSRARPVRLQDILLFCWAYEQEERPTFTKLMDMLEKLPKRNRRLSHPGHFWKSAE